MQGRGRCIAISDRLSTCATGEYRVPLNKEKVFVVYLRTFLIVIILAFSKTMLSAVLLTCRQGLLFPMRTN